MHMITLRELGVPIEPLTGDAAELRDAVLSWVDVEVVASIPSPYWSSGQPMGVFNSTACSIAVVEPSTLEASGYQALEILAHEVGHAAAVLTDDAMWWLSFMPFGSDTHMNAVRVEERIAYELSFDILRGLGRRCSEPYAQIAGTYNAASGHGFQRRLDNRRNALLSEGVPIVW